MMMSSFSSSPPFTSSILSPSQPSSFSHILSHLVPIECGISTGKTPFYSQDQLRLLISAYRPVPKHVAIIPDGNRRWATGKQLQCIDGYAHGANTLIKTALAAKELGISWLTVYSFSTENWKRPSEEISLLMALFEVHLALYTPSLIQAGISLNTIGNVSALPQSLQTTLENVKQATYLDNSQLTLTLAMNYGGRDELVRTFKKIVEHASSKEELMHTLCQDTINCSLDTKGIPDPDLIIRTSGERRLSNFLLWQSSYSEVYIEGCHWPDFTASRLLNAIIDYQSRERRLGGNSQVSNQASNHASSTRTCL